MNLLTLQDVTLSLGHHPLLTEANLIIHSGERCGLIGRNGSGKSSLLKLIDNRLEPDSGEVQKRVGLHVATVTQEPDLPSGIGVHDYLCANYLETEDWQRPALVEQHIQALGLPTDTLLQNLSGGMRKRVALAYAMLERPDLLLLDEPTNHLDFDGIRWLEEQILDFKGSVIVITHDRRFLDTVTTRIIELDRGQLFSFPGNFEKWQEQKAQWLEAEAQEQARFDKFLAQEEAWLRRGTRARRVRNQGRVRRLETLRRERAQRRERAGNVRFAVDEGRRSGRLVAEINNVNHGYDDRVLIRDFSTAIMRGDRIGILGPNGAGKTTLLNIILGRLDPDSGTVRHGTQLNVGFFDQMRTSLDDESTLIDAINPGNEWVEIGNERKHVISYLEDFLFDPDRAHSPVRTLSGGERARLALARLFTQPTNVLVLDEPTNDLDIETLELLEDLLADYAGTVLLVSHDRSFLNHVVTQVIAAEGNGHWQEYVGGYDDWLEQRLEANKAQQESTHQQKAVPQSQAKQKQSDNSTTTAAAIKTGTESASRGRKNQRSPRRLAPWEEKELKELPEQIAALEQRLSSLAEQLADPELYEGGPEKAQEIEAQIEKTEQEMEQLFERWEALESMDSN
ncbi:MAG TPA: ATP-binding cassette domain-containing protein [Paenalcaligenes sp.]|nr:ATP-binding cassette domain-containing protein [Paenalcaligenes sp.]